MAFPSGWLMLGFFMFILGAIIIFLWKRSERICEQVANAPELKIADLKPGFAVLKGVVKPKGVPLIAPHSHTRCVYYKYALEEKQPVMRSIRPYRGWSNTPRWITVERGEKRQNFFLDDGTGVVEINPSGAEIGIQQAPKARGQDGAPAVNPISMLRPALFTSTKHIEKRIAVGDDVCVVGTATGHSPSQGEMHRFIVAKGKDTSFFCISDKPKDALISHLKTSSRLLLGMGALAVLLGCFAFAIAVISMF